VIPVIETERLLMRGWREEDLGAYAEFYADDELARFVGGACARDEAWRRMATIVGHWTLRGFGMWALQEKVRAGFVGWCGLWYPEGWPEPEVGWGLVRSAQGRGLAVEAARAARDYAYGALGWSTLISFIDLQNHASRRVAERLGARFERTAMLRGAEAGLFRHPAPGALAARA